MKMKNQVIQGDCLEVMDTIYQCCKQGKDVNETPQKVHCEPTQALAIEWLKKNGGGIYRNVLHNFQYYVGPEYGDRKI